MCLIILTFSDYEGLDTVLRILSCKACFCLVIFPFWLPSFFRHALVLDSQLYEQFLFSFTEKPCIKSDLSFHQYLFSKPSISTFFWFQEVVKLLP